MLGWLALLPVCWTVLSEPFQEPENTHLIALDALLSAEKVEDREWRVSVWEHLIQLEQVENPLVLKGWEVLAASGSDPDRANLYLYQRRHGLELLAIDASAGPELVLESCLAAWGESKLGEARERLIEALQRFPEDQRLQENLLWLDGVAPDPVLLDGSARHLALAVLAARRSRG